MDHKSLIATLPADTLARLNMRADAPGLLHLAGHMGLITALGTWIALGLPLWQIMLIPQGITLCFLFTLAHEATHKTPFQTPWMNEVAGHLSGLILFMPFEWFRYYHLAHHRHTNDPARDPELMAGGRPESWGQYLWHITGLPFWYAMMARTVTNALGGDPGDYTPKRAHARIRREARIMLVIYALAAFSLTLSPLLFWVWLLPCLLGQPFLRLYLLAEHGRCAPVTNMLENTRTTLTNRIVRYLAWNMPYHTEHHTLPNVPFHQLPALHGLMQEHLGVVSPGYGAFTAEYARHLGPVRGGKGNAQARSPDPDDAG